MGGAKTDVLQGTLDLMVLKTLEARIAAQPPEIQARIGHQLRAMYDEVIRQGVPDRFASLIRKLDDPEAPKAGGSETEGSA